MNYFTLAGCIFTAVLALIALSTIIRACIGQLTWKNTFSVFAQCSYTAGFGTLAVWLFSITF